MTQPSYAKPPKAFATATAKRLLELHPNWYFFRIDPGTKNRGMPDNNISTGNTNDPKEIERWPVNSNVGLALKKSGLIVADVDTKPGKVGQATLEGLELEWGPMPETYTVRTGSGGLHYYYTETDTAKHVQGQNRFGPDIDCPGYVLIAGCQVDGKLYTTTAKASKLAPAPAWFADFLKPTEAAEADQAPVVEQDTPPLVERAIDFLRNDAKPSIQGSNGEKALLDVAGVLKDIGISEQQSVELIDEHYNVDDKCIPLWPLDELTTKVRNAWLYLKQNAPGSRTAVAAFERDVLTDADIDRGIVADVVWRAKRANAKAMLKGTAARGIGDNSGDGLMILDMDKVKARNVDFIWPGRLARGKQTALAGVGGIGKSQITVDCAARVSNGAAWPDIKEIRAAGWPKELERAPQGYVIIMSAEDAPDDTILPRIIAAGGNPKYIKFLNMVKEGDGERKFSLQTDLAKLKAYCLALGNVALIIIDPASSYMGGDIDAGKNAKVRHVLDPITNLAEELQCAIISITHFRKGTSAKAVEKVMDSVAFVNAPRCALAVYENPDRVGEDFLNAPAYVMLRLKSNLPGTPPVGLTYDIEGVEGGSKELTDYRDGKPIKTSRIKWRGSTDITADQVAQMEGDRGSPKFDDARRFLAKELPEDGGPKFIAELTAAAEAEGIAPDTLKRAKRSLKVKSKKSGPEAGAPWVWYRGRELDFEPLPAGEDQ